MKHFKFSYSLKAQYSSPIEHHNFSALLIPCDTARQKINELNVSVSDCESFSEAKDNFGNKRIYGVIEKPHSSFEIRVSGTAQAGLDIFEEYTSDPFQFSLFKAQTELTAPGEKIREYHREISAEELDGPYDKALHIMNSLHRDFGYVSGMTDVHESAETAFSLGEGVCQDYAHIMLSLLRLEGIPARYAVGMIPGEGSSHAWAEALCRGYWYGFDPTNGKLVNDDYVRISCGRDFNDCSVIRGSFYGMPDQDQQETVLVEEIQ